MSYLEIIIGPMFSGKTSELIKIYKEKKENNEKILAINYNMDTRYGDNKIVSHNIDSIPSININSLHDINSDLDRKSAFNNADWIFINEAQFFKDLKIFIILYLKNSNKKFVLCGLDSDFKRERFGELLDLVPHADKLTKLYGKCHYCNNKSLYTHRLTSEMHQEVIGTNNYIPICRSCCFNKINIQ